MRRLSLIHISEPMYERDELHNAPGIIDIIRRNQDRTYRDYIYTAYRELLPGCDQVVVSGKSFVDKIAGPVLKYAKECDKNTMLWGMDIPLCPALFDHGIHHITGFIADDAEPVSYTHLDVYKRQDLHRNVLTENSYFVCGSFSL